MCRYAGLAVSGRTISFTVANVGFYDGAEVAQLYIGFPASSGEPPQALKVRVRPRLRQYRAGGGGGFWRCAAFRTLSGG